MSPTDITILVVFAGAAAYEIWESMKGDPVVARVTMSAIGAMCMGILFVALLSLAACDRALTPAEIKQQVAYCKSRHQKPYYLTAPSPGAPVAVRCANADGDQL